MRCDGGLHGAGPVSSGNAGGDAHRRLNGHGEGGGVLGAVAHGHWWQAQALATLTGEGQANQTPAIAGHEVDAVSGDVVRRQHQVTFVFTVFFVHQDHNAARPQVGHDVFDGRDGNPEGCRAGCQGNARGEGGGAHAVSFCAEWGVSEGAGALSMRST